MISRSMAFRVFHPFRWSGIGFYVESFEAVCCFKMGIRLGKTQLVQISIL